MASITDKRRWVTDAGLLLQSLNSINGNRRFNALAGHLVGNQFFTEFPIWLAAGNSLQAQIDRSSLENDDNEPLYLFVQTCRMALLQTTCLLVQVAGVRNVTWERDVADIGLWCNQELNIPNLPPPLDGDRNLAALETLERCGWARDGDIKMGRADRLLQLALVTGHNYFPQPAGVPASNLLANLQPAIRRFREMLAEHRTRIGPDADRYW